MNAQWKTLPSFGLSYSYSIFGSYYTEKIASITGYNYSKNIYFINVPYQLATVSFGADLVYNNKCSLSIKGEYQYLYCKERLLVEPHMKNSIRSHFVGINLSYRIRESKIIRPFIGFGIITELITNYKNKFLSTEDYDPQIIFAPNYQSTVAINTNLYQSTPLIGSLLLGCNIKIHKELSANISLGYSLKILNSQYAVLYFKHNISNEPILIEKIGQPYSLALNYMTIQLGLSYAFDVHKKKPKTKGL